MESAHFPIKLYLHLIIFIWWAKKRGSFYIFLINGKVEVIFIYLLAIYSFIMDSLYPSPAFELCVDICCFCSASLSPSCDNSKYCGEPIPCGLGEYITRSGLPESHSSFATVIKEWACNPSQAKEYPQWNFCWNSWKERSSEIPRTKDCVSLKICTMWKESEGKLRG